MCGKLGRGGLPGIWSKMLAKKTGAYSPRLYAAHRMFVAGFLMNVNSVLTVTLIPPRFCSVS
jgi:hypothetical protein